MNKLCLVFLGVLVFALHLASQVQAQNATVAPKNANTTTVALATTMGHHNTTGNSTQDKSAGGRTEVCVLLLPLALGLLHGWS